MVIAITRAIAIAMVISITGHNQSYHTQPTQSPQSFDIHHCHYHYHNYRYNGPSRVFPYFMIRCTLQMLKVSRKEPCTLACRTPRPGTCPFCSISPSSCLSKTESRWDMGATIMARIFGAIFKASLVYWLFYNLYCWWWSICTFSFHSGCSSCREFWVETGRSPRATCISSWWARPSIFQSTGIISTRTPSISLHKTKVIRNPIGVVRLSRGGGGRNVLSDMRYILELISVVSSRRLWR